MSSYYSRYSPSYEPMSPPSSDGGSPPYRYYGPPRAPVMPYATLPAVDPPMPPSPRSGLMTPPPSPDSSVNGLLRASPTVVRYDFTTEPRTIRMLPPSEMSTFSITQPASFPSRSTIYIECEVSGLVIPIHNDRSAYGITCADIFMQLYAYFARRIPSDEWRRVPEPQRSAMKAACSRRTARRDDPTMRMIDYLLGYTTFKRLVPKSGRRSSTPTWLLQTTM